MAHSSYRIVYERGDRQYKLVQIVFGRDGSYYVTSPYHPEGKAILLLATVNYALGQMAIKNEDAIELASVDDEQKKLKLSHHVSGWVQFSGEAILSGFDENGEPKGVAVRSWPLPRPVRGPAFGATIRGIEQFQEHTGTRRGGTCVFRANEVVTEPGADVIFVEGQYFPSAWRRFIRSRADGTMIITVNHPAGAALSLKVLLPPEKCALQGFIGVEVYAQLDDSQTPTPSFMLAGPTGNLRKNDEGQYLADGIFCMYPRMDINARRSVNYRLPEVPQS